MYLSFPTIGQDNLDSLWLVWSDMSKPDTTRIDALYSFSWDGYLFSQPDSAFYFAQLGYDYAKIKNLKKQMAKTSNVQGVSFWVRGDYNRAIEYYTISLTNSEQINDKKGVGASLSNIGLVYSDKGDYDKAIEYYTRSLTIREKIEDKNGIAASLNNIGLIYYNLNDYKAAIDYHTQSLTIRKILEDKKGVAASLNNIGLVYEDQKDYDKAIDYYTRSLVLKQEMGDDIRIASSLNNIGIIYKKRGDYPKAIEYYKRSLSIREKVGDKKGVSSTLTNLGNVYSQMGDYAKATTYGIKALSIAEEIDAAIESKNASLSLYETYKAFGKSTLALEMFEYYIATRDSIDSEKNQEEIIRQEYKYSYEKQAISDSIAFVKEQKIKDALIKVQNLKLKNDKIQRVALYAGLFFVLLFLGYIFSRLKIAHKHKLIIDQQNKELKEYSRIVSHDLKAPLRAIHTLSQWVVVDLADEKYEEVTSNLNLLIRRVKKMSDFIDSLLEHSKSGKSIPKNSDVDCKLLIDNLIEFLMIPDSIQVIYDNSLPSLKIPETQVSQIFQNLISNAVKYMDKDIGMINIGCEESNGKFVFYVKDNGRGIDESYQESIFDLYQIIPEGEKDQTGVGLSIVKKIINDYDGEIWVESELGIGSTFYFTLAKEYR